MESRDCGDGGDGGGTGHHNEEEEAAVDAAAAVATAVGMEIPRTSLYRVKA